MQSSLIEINKFKDERVLMWKQMLCDSLWIIHISQWNTQSEVSSVMFYNHSIWESAKSSFFIFKKKFYSFICSISLCQLIVINLNLPSSSALHLMISRTNGYLEWWLSFISFQMVDFERERKIWESQLEMEEVDVSIPQWDQIARVERKKWWATL